MKAVAAGVAPRSDPEDSGLDDLGSEEQHDPVNRPHELRVAVSPAHATGDRKLGECRLDHVRNEVRGGGAAAPRPGVRPRSPWGSRAGEGAGVHPAGAGESESGVGCPSLSNAAARAGPRRSRVRPGTLPGTPRAMRASRGGREGFDRLAGETDPREPLAHRVRERFGEAAEALRRELLGADLREEVAPSGLSHRPPPSRTRARCVAAGESRAARAGKPGSGRAPRDRAHTQEVALALGHRERSSRVEEVEDVRCLEDHLVGGEREVRGREPAALRLAGLEPVEQDIDRRVGEVVGGHLLLVLEIQVAVGHRVGPGEVVDAVHPLEVHRHPFEAVGELCGHRTAVDAARLLEIGELGDLHPVQPDLPAEAPRSEGGGLPVILDEADVVHQGIDAEGFEGAEVEGLDVRRGRLEDHLVLVVVLEPVGVLPVASVRRAPGGLHVGGPPRLGADCAQERRGVERAGPHLHVVGLLEHAAFGRPVGVEGQNHVLEQHGWEAVGRPRAKRAASIAAPPRRAEREGRSPLHRGRMPPGGGRGKRRSPRSL